MTNSDGSTLTFANIEKWLKRLDEEGGICTTNGTFSFKAFSCHARHCAILSGFNHLMALVIKSNFSNERGELPTGLRKCVDCKWSHKKPDCPLLMDVSAY